MTIKTRRLIYIFIIIMFLVIAPILILSNSGLRYDFKKREFVKTGSLVLDSYPRGADIYINNKPYQNFFSGGAWRTIFRLFSSRSQEKNIQKTPLVINNLLPNEYLVSFKKNNYKTWSKTLSIEPRQAYFVDNIFLFLEQPETENIFRPNNKISQIEISPNQKSAVVAVSDQLYLFDLRSQKNQLLFKTDQAFSLISWSPDSKKILLNEKKSDIISYSFVDTETKAVAPLRSFKNYVDLKNLKWDKKNEWILYGVRNNIIYRINLFNQEIQPFLRVNTTNFIANYLIKNLDVFYLKKEASHLCLYKTSLITSANTLKIKDNSRECLAELPFFSNSNYEISDIDDNLLLLKNQERQKIYLIDAENKKIILEAKAKAVLFLNDGPALIYWNDFEIWQLRLKDYITKDFNLTFKVEDKILSRFSQKIKMAISHPKEKHVFFTLEQAGKNDTLVALELDSGNKIHLTRLIEAPEINNIFLTKEQDYIYIWANFGEDGGIYQIKIQ